MARMRQKGDLPTKICARCRKPFTWRKRWARNWDEVRYCSERCRGERTPSAIADRPRLIHDDATDMLRGGTAKR